MSRHESEVACDERGWPDFRFSSSAATSGDDGLVSPWATQRKSRAFAPSRGVGALGAAQRQPRLERERAASCQARHVVSGHAPMLRGCSAPALTAAPSCVIGIPGRCREPSGPWQRAGRAAVRSLGARIGRSTCRPRACRHRTTRSCRMSHAAARARSMRRRCGRQLRGRWSRWRGPRRRRRAGER